MLDLILFHIQHIYSDRFMYLEKLGNMMLSLTDISARLASIPTGITHIQADVDKIYMYLVMLLTHTVSALLCAPSNLREVLENIRKGMVHYPWLALPSDSNEHTWSYNKILQKSYCV